MKKDKERLRALRKTSYADLNSRQRENYNFHTVAALLADYGFNSIRLSDDWHGADFLAYHVSGKGALKVQLKSRPMIAKRYQKKGLHLAFPLGDCWYLVEHDRLVRLVGKTTNWLKTRSWLEKGAYSTVQPNPELLKALMPHALGSVTIESRRRAARGQARG